MDRWRQSPSNVLASETCMGRIQLMIVSEPGRCDRRTLQEMFSHQHLRDVMKILDRFSSEPVTVALSSDSPMVSYIIVSPIPQSN